MYPAYLYDTGVAAKAPIPGMLAIGPGIFGPPTMATVIDVDQMAKAAEQPLVDALSTNLNTFAGHGGKQIFYHGDSDPWFSALDTLGYYQAMAADNGGLEKVSEWSRFFFVPGMGHCGGGEAALDNFDMLGAIVNWVERGITPQSVETGGKAFPGRTRPLCAYPKHAQYRGAATRRRLRTSSAGELPKRTNPSSSLAQCTRSAPIKSWAGIASNAEIARDAHTAVPGLVLLIWIGPHNDLRNDKLDRAVERTHNTSGNTNQS